MALSSSVIWVAAGVLRGTVKLLDEVLKALREVYVRRDMGFSVVGGRGYLGPKEFDKRKYFFGTFNSSNEEE